MTIGTIFERYEVPDSVEQEALCRGAFVLALHRVWVGPEVNWQLLVKALVFADLGEQSGHIRKKIGLDKYVVTLITRGVPKFSQTVASSHDWHQKLYVYCLWHDADVVHTVDPKIWENVKAQVERNVLEVPKMSEPNPAMVSSIRNTEIYHYKNPSV